MDDDAPPPSLACPDKAAHHNLTSVTKGSRCSRYGIRSYSVLHKAVLASSTAGMPKVMAGEAQPRLSLRAS